jgi:spore coat protein JB
MDGMNNGTVGGVTNNGNGMNGRTDMNGNGGMNNGRNLNGTPLNNGGGMTYGVNPNGGALSGSLADQIRALGFVKAELELYLDTHPRCRTALDYYYKTIQELKRLTEQYENTVGPLTAMGNVSTDQWHWVDGPWPWQQAGDFMREGDR